MSLSQFLAGDDMDFYERFLVNLSDEEIDVFFKLNPGFLKDYHVNRSRRRLLQDRLYRGVLKGIYRKK